MTLRGLTLTAEVGTPKSGQPTPPKDVAHAERTDNLHPQPQKLAQHQTANKPTTRHFATKQETRWGCTPPPPTPRLPQRHTADTLTAFFHTGAWKGAEAVKDCAVFFTRVRPP